MALVRWEPLREMATLQTEMNRLFGTFFDTPTTAVSGNGTRRWLPPMDLVETEEHFVLRADLPGLAEDDVQIEVQDRTLTVSGERKAEHEANGEGYYRLERAGTDPAGGRRRRADRRALRARRARGPHPEARGAQAAPDHHPGGRR